MFDFNFPEYGVNCKVCESPIPLERYRTTGICDDCEFERLAPDSWPEPFFAALAIWRRNKASG